MHDAIMYYILKHQVIRDFINLKDCLVRDNGKKKAVLSLPVGR